MQSVLGADCAVTTVVGEERTACNKGKKNRTVISGQIKPPLRNDISIRECLHTPSYHKERIGSRDARAREFGRGNHLQGYYDVLASEVLSAVARE